MDTVVGLLFVWSLVNIGFSFVNLIIAVKRAL